MTDPENSKGETPKIFGVLDYWVGIAIGLVLTLVASAWVYIQYDEEERVKFFGIGFFNLVCLGATCIMRK